jgi:transposase InsO family protein
LIDAEKANYPIVFMCRLLNVPRSSFYAWRHRAESATAARRRELAEHIRRVFGEHRGRYGCRRIAGQLNAEGHVCSVGLVADLMRELGLTACQPRAYRRTTLGDDQPVATPDLVEREFTAPAPGQRLVGDITYLRTGQGWLYLLVTWNLAAWLRPSRRRDDEHEDRAGEVAGVGSARPGDGVVAGVGRRGPGAAHHRGLRPCAGRVPALV